MAQLVHYLLVATVCLQVTETYKFLVIPAHMKSHIGCFVGFGKELSKRGHEQHYIFNEAFDVPGSLKNIKNTKFISYKQPPGRNVNFDEVFQSITKTAIEKDATDLAGFYKTFMHLLLEEIGVLTMENEEFMAKLAAEKYDYAIVDSFFLLKYHHLVPHRLGIPVISLVDVVEPIKARIPWLPSHVPFFALQATEKMDFMERVKNLVAYIAWEIFDPTPQLTAEIKDVYNQYGAFSSLHDLESRTVYWIVTHDYAMDYPRPSMDNVLNVGGLATSPPKPVTGDLLKFVEGAADGVIVMTFGSMAGDLPGHLIRKFVAAFKHFDGKLRVIWRLKNEAKIKVPSNVLLSNWLPQNDLLGHPNVKLFITHCGNNGQFEGMYNGVPMIGFPLFGDQFSNALRLTYKHYGMKMMLKEFEPDELIANINTLVYNDHSYARTVELASREFRDRPETPGERAAFWIEHVVRYGTQNMRSYGADMPLYQYLMLDVVGFIAIVSLTALSVLFRIVRFLFRLLLRLFISSEVKIDISCDSEEKIKEE